jgi:hypothetical protein
VYTQYDVHSTYISLEQEDERDEKHRGVQIVVVQQHALIVIHDGQDARRVDAVERHEDGGQHTRGGAHERKVYFSLDAADEADNNNQQSGAGQNTRALVQDQVREDDVENQGQTPCDVVCSEIGELC